MECLYIEDPRSIEAKAPYYERLRELEYFYRQDVAPILAEIARIDAQYMHTYVLVNNNNKETGK